MTETPFRDQPLIVASDTYQPRHYPTNAEMVADLVVHIVGLTLAIAGGGVMLGFAIATGSGSLITAISVYAIGTILMLSFSTIYNFAPSAKRLGRNRFDHAGIFIMIGASYTPFTTQSLTGAWSWSMTGIIWGIVGLCVAAKLADVRLPNKFWIAMYISLGWIIVVAVVPMITAVPWLSILFLLLGGIIYTSGIIFHVGKALAFSKAVWHGHVVVAATLHWTAILLGVVFAP